MPPLPAVNKVIEAQWLYSVGEDVNCMSRLFFAYTGTSDTTPDLATWAGHWGADMNSFVLLLSNKFANRGMVLTDLTSALSPRASAVLTATGGVAGTCLPGEVAMCIDLQVGRRYRGGKPRVYISGIDSAALSDAQLWDPTHVTNWTTAFTNGINAFIGHAPADLATVAQVAVSYYHGFSVVVSPTTGRARNVPSLRAVPAIDPVIGISINPRPASQRRRSLIRR